MRNLCAVLFSLLVLAGVSSAALADSTIGPGNITGTVPSGSKPYYINRTLVGQTSTTTGWITVNASGYIPAGAIAIILSTEVNGWGPDGGVPNARTLMREYGKTVQYSLVTFRCSAGGDWCASNNQGIYPIDAARRFQWAQTGTGITNGIVRIYVEGYYL